MKARIIIFILILCLILPHTCSGLESPQTSASVFSTAPEWLQGTLCMSLQKADSLDDSYFQDAVCFFDFSQKKISILEIPPGSVLMEDYNQEGMPVICYPQKTNSAGSEFISDPWKWRMYTVEQIAYNSDEDNYYLNNSRTDYFDAPMAILGVHSENLFSSAGMSTEYGMYALSYGIDDACNLSIDLVYKDFRGNFEKKCSFPLNHDFGGWGYSISENGAILSNHGDELLLSDGSILSAIEDPSIDRFSEICWIDEQQFVYLGEINVGQHMKMDKTYCVKIWDCESNSNRHIVDRTGNAVCFDFMPTQMAVTNDGSTLAIYGNNFGYAAKVVFINLETGEKYDFSCFPEAKFVNDADRKDYGYTSEGDIYLSSGTVMEPIIVWYD